MNAATLLDRVQSLPTSGARAVAPFNLNGVMHLAIPQLAKDVSGQFGQGGRRRQLCSSSHLQMDRIPFR